MADIVAPLIGFATVFTALGLACAVWIALPKRHRQGDPCDPPLGEVMGFSREQLDHFAKRSRLSMRRDPFNRSLDISLPPETPQRTATGGRSMPFGVFAGRTLSDEEWRRDEVERASRDPVARAVWRKLQAERLP